MSAASGAPDEGQFAAGREQLRRAAADGERLYRKRMFGEFGANVADDNRIDGILTRELVDALALVDALIAETDDELERWEETTAARLDAHAAEQDAAALRSRFELVARMAERGVGPDTTAEQCLATIAHFARAARADGSLSALPGSSLGVET